MGALCCCQDDQTDAEYPNDYMQKRQQRILKQMNNLKGKSDYTYSEYSCKEVFRKTQKQNLWQQRVIIQSCSDSMKNTSYEGQSEQDHFAPNPMLALKQGQALFDTDEPCVNDLRRSVIVDSTPRSMESDTVILRESELQLCQQQRSIQMPRNIMSPQKPRTENLQIGEGDKFKVNLKNRLEIIQDPDSKSYRKENNLRLRTPRESDRQNSARYNQQSSAKSLRKLQHVRQNLQAQLKNQNEQNAPFGRRYSGFTFQEQTMDSSPKEHAEQSKENNQNVSMNLRS